MVHAIALCSAVLAQSGAVAAPLRDPNVIFANARQRLESARYPAQISYDVVITVEKSGKISVARYRSYYDSTTGAIRVIGVTDEEIAHPYTPRGVNTYLNLFGSGKGIPLSAPQRTFDFLGVPILAPNYSFGIAEYIPRQSEPDYSGLVEQIRREFHDPSKQRAAPAPRASPGLKTIASVEAIYREYILSLAGVAPICGHLDYHLLLEPLREPDRYRLRQIWVNAATFALDRVVTQGNFVFGGATGVTWTTDFGDVAGAPYIESEHTSQRFADERHKYDSATVAFTNIATAKIPAYGWISDFRVNVETGVPALVEPF